MPRYPYECLECSHTQVHFHGFSETIDSCPQCSQESYKRCVSRPTFTRSESVEKEEKTGSKTREYIEANRELLKDMKEESSKETYEPS
jgi:putative FmdB family regulatory protein